MLFENGKLFTNIDIVCQNFMLDSPLQAEQKSMV